MEEMQTGPAGGGSDRPARKRRAVGVRVRGGTGLLKTGTAGSCGIRLLVVNSARLRASDIPYRAPERRGTLCPAIPERGFPTSLPSQSTRTRTHCVSLSPCPSLPAPQFWAEFNR